MYVRFVIETRDEDSLEPLGIFHAARALSRNGELLEHEQQLFDEAWDWFRDHLERPERFARSRRPGAHSAAISWFKSSAREHVANARKLVSLLEAHGETVRMLTTDRPGYVVYEDEHQVAAEPFRGER